MLLYIQYIPWKRKGNTNEIQGNQGSVVPKTNKEQKNELQTIKQKKVKSERLKVDNNWLNSFFTEEQIKTFKKAIIDPEKVIAPTAAPIDISIKLPSFIFPGEPRLKASGFKNAAIATNTAASPTKL